MRWRLRDVGSLGQVELLAVNAEVDGCVEVEILDVEVEGFAEIDLFVVNVEVKIVCQ